MVVLHKFILKLKEQDLKGEGPWVMFSVRTCFVHEYDRVKKILRIREHREEIVTKAHRDVVTHWLIGKRLLD